MHERALLRASDWLYQLKTEVVSGTRTGFYDQQVRFSDR